MYMRIFSLLALLALSACGGTEKKGKTLAELEQSGSARATNDQQPVSDEQEKINCAVGGAADVSRSCMIERAYGDKGLALTLRHADGGFRRLRVTKDGRGVVAADGAEVAVVKPINKGLIEVSIGGDRYQLPATVKGGAAPPR
jgi:hypothetical protein